MSSATVNVEVRVSVSVHVAAWLLVVVMGGCSGSGEQSGAGGASGALGERDSCAACERSCDAGEAARCHAQAGRYLRGRIDLEKASAGFDAACRNGHLAACSALALQVQDGRGVARDLDRARALYRRSCDGGVGVGCFNLALMMSPSDPEARALMRRAEELYTKQCDAGDLQWCTNLGVLYENGFLGHPDPPRAELVYRKACDRVLGDWCVNLALLHLDRGEPPGTWLALLDRTCAADVPLACGVLGQLFLKETAWHRSRYR